MKLRAFFLLALLACTPSMASAVAAPTGLTAGAYVNGTMPLYWTEDATVAQWYIYLDGKMLWSPNRSQTTLNGSVRSYVVQPLAPANTYIFSMRAVATGQPLSAASANLTVTASPVPVTYVMTPPGVPLLISGTTGGGGGGVVTQGTTPWVVGGGVSVSNTVGSPVYISPVAAGLFGGNGTVTQGGPWTVSGSVSVTNNQGLSVTASQGSAWTVSGSVGVTSEPTSFRGVSIVADTTTRFYGMTLTASNIALPVSVTAWPAARLGVTVTSISATERLGVTISASSIALPVSVTAWPAAFLGVSVVSGLGSVSITSVPLATSLPAYTSAAPLPVGATLTAIASTLSTTITAGSALNTAIRADYDVNTKTAQTRRFAETASYFYSATGTATITASGYNVLYSMIIRPSTTTGAIVTLFDGAVTRVSVSGDNAHSYQPMRGIAFKNGAMTISITGTSYTGAVALECDR